MRTLHYPGVWLAIGYLLVAAVVLASLMPPPTGGFEVNDKLLHVSAYLILALWFGLVYRRERFARVGQWLVALGVLIEFLQSGTGYRSFEIADMLVDALGVVAGLLLAATPLGSALHWAERWLPRHG